MSFVSLKSLFFGWGKPISVVEYKLSMCEYLALITGAKTKLTEKQYKNKSKIILPPPKKNPPKTKPKQIRKLISLQSYHHIFMQCSHFSNYLSFYSLLQSIHIFHLITVFYICLIIDWLLFHPFLSVCLSLFLSLFLPSFSLPHSLLPWLFSLSEMGCHHVMQIGVELTI